MKRYLFALASVAIVGAIALMALGAGRSTEAGGPPFDAGLARAIEVQEAHTDALMARLGVVGTAVGLTAAGQPAVLVLVESAGVRGFPATLDGVPLRVKVTGEIFALHHQCGHDKPTKGDCPETPTDPLPPEPGSDCPPTSRCERPVPIGVSMGSERFIDVGGTTYCTTGTYGMRVTDGNDVFALSNAHVFAHEGSTTIALAGQGNSSTKIGDRILQPGPADTSCLKDLGKDVVGTLAAYVSLLFGNEATCLGGVVGQCNLVDAAIALSTVDLLGNATPSDGYGTPQSDTILPSINMKVKKYGRTTGLTNGRISAINAFVLINYDSGLAMFANQIIVEPGSFSAGGDSGSLIVGRGRGIDGKPVGLLFAGSFFVTVANPIDAVLDAFDVTIDGQ